MGSSFVNVALPIAFLFEKFIYKVDPNKWDLNEEDLIGRRVIVPFNNTVHVGIITDIVTNKIDPDKINFEIKEVLNIPDKYPVYTKEYIEIIEKLSDYYVSPVGMSLYYGMPDPLRLKGSDTVKPLNPVYVPLVNNIDSVNIRSKRARELLNILISKGDLSLEEIKELGFTRKDIKYLLERGLIKEVDLYFKETGYSLKSNWKIYSYGKDFIKSGLFLYDDPDVERRFQRYINMIANLIYQGKSSLLIFPNIQSLKLAYERLKPIFGEKLYIYFDGLRSRDKVKTWFDLKNMKGLICIGTFSSVFIPIKNLSLIVVEEEYSNNYKMIRTPRFDIRRFCIEIYEKFKDVTVLFSASAPSVESYYLYKRGFLKKFSKKRKIEKKPIKKVEIGYSEVDSFLKKNVNIREKTLILVNRTGLASFLSCPSCGFELECPRCKVNLKVFKNGSKYLKCQICGKKYEYVDNCPKCDTKLTVFGFGVEKIKQSLEKKFPNKVSYLYETDKNTPIKITTVVNNKDLLIPKFDTVINVFPDVFLRDSFKGDEDFFRNIFISYIKTKKKLIVLTKNGNHNGFKALEEGKPEYFYTEELERRKLLEYPPFVNIILLVFEKKNLTLEEVENLFNEWLKEFNITKIDYEGAYFSKIPYARNRFRYTIILKNFKEKEYLKELFLIATQRNIKLTINVAPRSI